MVPREKHPTGCYWLWGRRWPLEAGEGKETDSPREPPERNTALSTPSQTSGLGPKTINLRQFQALRL